MLLCIPSDFSFITWFQFNKPQTQTISDGEASLINAWQKVFLNIKYVLYAVHFAKNISDYMKYVCNPPLSPALQKFVMHLFQGSKPVTGLIDMDSDQIAASKDKILLAM